MATPNCPSSLRESDESTSSSTTSRRRAPGLDSPLAAELVEAVRARGGGIGPKYGWTDVARFSAAGVPAVNLGPGDPVLCHTDDEHCPVDQIDSVASILRDWLA